MGFEPIRTARLILRAPSLDDLDAAVARRNLAEVARYQDWELPYTREQAEQSMARAVAMEGPTDGAGWSLTVVDASSPKTILGDLYVELKWGGRVGYIGYTFHPDHWGRGYATEAATALVEYLFVELGVSRVEASLHPDNLASARVLETCGLVVEGLTRQSFWVGDVCSDDLLYGIPRAGWDAWCGRPRHHPERIDLVPVTADNAVAVAGLTTHWSQRRLGASMLDHLRDVVAPPLRSGVPLAPWCRAIEADGEVVGFLLTSEPTEAHPRPAIERLLIDRMHQRRGIGRSVLDEYEHRCRDQGANAVEARWRDVPGSPSRMFVDRGYEPVSTTEGETLAVKRLS